MGKVKTAYLDTHCVLWLHDALTGNFSKKALKALEENLLIFSPIVRLELQFLKEIKRVKHSPSQILLSLKLAIGLEEAQKLSMNDVVESSLDFSWTRDPFDRLIVAEASLQNIPLITADKNIRKHFNQVIW